MRRYSIFLNNMRVSLYIHLYKVKSILRITIMMANAYNATDQLDSKGIVGYQRRSNI